MDVGSVRRAGASAQDRTHAPGAASPLVGERALPGRLDLVAVADDPCVRTHALSVVSRPPAGSSRTPAIMRAWKR
ncbi:hypothetical protein DVA67_030170 [Solirubrobacter sp. CPCC 204708]|nr:hypothetical protein [Solirubrobacter deserti]